MPTLLPSAEQQFPDGDGAPLVGGLVYFFVPGTTTPKDTWQDAAGTTKNQNPVILDAAGRAIIYGTGSYRQVVKDAAGNLIWDQITADTASSAASWAGTSTGTQYNVILNAPNFASVDGQAIDFILGVSIGGASQVTVNNTAIPLKLDTLSGPVQTPAGCAVAGNRYRVTYDATGGFLHLTADADRPYVDGVAGSILGAAEAYAIQAANNAQAAAISAAESYAAGQASAAQSAAQAFATQAASNAQSAAASDASSKANAAQSAATSAAESFAANADASVLSSAESYAASQASSAQQAAQSFATNADATVTSNANAYATNQAAAALSSAKGYSDSQLASAQSSNAATYVQGVRLSGIYTPGLPYSRASGQVIVYVNFSPNSLEIGNIQFNINGTWVTASG